MGMNFFVSFGGPFDEGPGKRFDKPSYGEIRRGHKRLPVEQTSFFKADSLSRLNQPAKPAKPRETRREKSDRLKKQVRGMGFDLKEKEVNAVDNVFNKGKIGSKPMFIRGFRDASFAVDLQAKFENPKDEEIYKMGYQLGELTRESNRLVRLLRGHGNEALDDTTRKSSNQKLALVEAKLLEYLQTCADYKLDK